MNEQPRPFRLPRAKGLGLACALVEKLTGLSKLDQLYLQRPAGLDTRSFLRHTLEALGISYHLASGSTEDIPKTGATLVVANHPLGGGEGVILAELLLMVRPDVKVMANHFLKRIPELDELFIGVDVFEGQDAVKANLAPLREANEHLKQDGLLLIFPAGEVSALDRKTRTIQDKQWSRIVGRLARKYSADVLPVYVDGENSSFFYRAGLVHERFRTLLLGRELLNKQDRSIGLHFGDLIGQSELKALTTDTEVTAYLRLNTYLLANPNIAARKGNAQQGEPIAAAMNETLLNKDIQELPPEALLLSSGEFDVYCTQAANLPHMMQEIGRLREQSFRAVGEGTGLALDVDKFDVDYLQLFIWQREKSHLVGAYRLGLVDQLMADKGLDGLYSHTLFQYDEDFLVRMGKAIEMGRSVVSQEYQQSMGALLLLWQGIATYVYRNPEYRTLFGPVSISNDYSPLARQLMAQTLSLHHYDERSVDLVSARHPLQQDKKVFWTLGALSALADIKLLSKVVSRLEGGKGLPVLLRQYLGLKGKFVSFNLDPEFSDALDGLILVDLTQISARTLVRYMGKEQASSYFSFHENKGDS